jgi:stearoyl-CoA desaturase (delta-9 desaturase)
MTLFLYVLVMTHITIACVTLYLHRSQAHRGVTFEPRVAHFMRFWLWLTTGMVTKQWVAVHRKHHRFTDEPGDPHSPHNEGIWQVLLGGVYYYIETAKDQQMVEQYGAGTPEDWMEQHVYTPFNFLGVVLMLLIDCVLFGWWGIYAWGLQMAWIPFWAAGVINGLGHWWGYRNTKTDDYSTNISPWGIVIGGEELHNNHHADPASPKLSQRPWEFDLGWAYIRLLQRFDLATVRSPDLAKIQKTA